MLGSVSEVEKWRSQLFEDEIVSKFRTKTTPLPPERNMQFNILFDGCYLPFEEYLQEKNIFLYPETVPRNRPKFFRNSTRR